MASQPQATLRAGTFKVSRPVAYLLRLVLIGIVVWIAYLSPPLQNWAKWVSALGWVAFSVYWGAAARNSAPAKSSEATESRRVHEVLVNVGLFLLYLPVPGFRQSFLPPSAAWIPAGLAMQASFFALAVWARRHLGSNWSGRIEIKMDHELVRSGPYRLLRHPIYTAMVGMYVGTALMVGQMHSLAGVAMVFFAYWRKVRMEEAKMREAFGSKYDDYRRATWGAVPGLF